MKQEDKELLLKDLCARLPYGVMVKITNVSTQFSKDETLSPNRFYSIDDDNILIKPYLRPMSSMTEEDMEELLNIDKKKAMFSSSHLTLHIDGEIFDYLNKKMFDWRGLIPMNLALEAPEGMYK